MLMEEISLVSATDDFLILFNVISLFTNISLIEIIDITINLILENDPNIKFTKHELRNLFRIATFETLFLFNGNVFDQADGVAIKSLLVPILSNLIFHGQNYIEKAKNVKLTFYKRYLDS